MFNVKYDWIFISHSKGLYNSRIIIFHFDFFFRAFPEEFFCDMTPHHSVIVFRLFDRIFCLRFLKILEVRENVYSSRRNKSYLVLIQVLTF